MRFYAVSGSAARQRTECAIVGLYESGTLSAAAAQVDAALGGRVGRLVKRRDARGKLGDCTLLDVEHGPCERVLVVGLGKKESFGRKQYKNRHPSGRHDSKYRNGAGWSRIEPGDACADRPERDRALC